ACALPISGGLRVTTTIVEQHQEAAVEAVEAFTPTGENADDITTALTAVRPGDGAITAMYGGEDYQQTQLNAATDAQVQAGSLFKPVTLAAAVGEGISTNTELAGPSPSTAPTSSATRRAVRSRPWRRPWPWACLRTPPAWVRT